MRNALEAALRKAWIDLAHEGDNPWELVATHKYKDGAAQGEGSR